MYEIGDTVLNNTGTILLQAILYISQIRKQSLNNIIYNATLAEKGLDPFFKNDTMRCYGIYGCFSTDGVWIDRGRPVNEFPIPPQQLSPSFCLHTRDNPNVCQFLNHSDRNSIYKSFYAPFHKTYIVTHGFLETGDRPWLKKIAREILSFSDSNVILIDWGNGSPPPYTQAVANIRLVSRWAALLIHSLVMLTGTNAKDIHIIGHSLGAHLSGYIGHTLKSHFNITLGRITGMDPAEPHFSKTDTSVRLDPSDASFVDIIHSNARPFVEGGLGMDETIGHYDFFPNSGDYQPGCDAGFNEQIKKQNESAFLGVKKFLACNHVRSHEYFLESINSKCNFTSVECDSWSNFLKGECFPCKSEQVEGKMCANMGMSAINTRINELKVNERSVFKRLYTITNSESPFCAVLYRITINISNSSKSYEHKGEVGGFSMILHGDESDTNAIKVFEGQIFLPGTSHKRVIGSSDIGQIKSATLNWIHSMSFIPYTWRFESVTHVGSVLIETFTDHQKIKLCPEEEKLEAGKGMMLMPCK